MNKTDMLAIKIALLIKYSEVSVDEAQVAIDRVNERFRDTVFSQQS